MVTLNLLLFVPLGFLITAVFKKINFNYKKVLLSGCVFSCSIEFLQLFAGRFFEIDDIIANTLGTLIGYLFWQSFNGMRDKRTRGQALIKGMVTILSTISLIFCLSLVANNDFITEDYDKYSEMGFSEEEINDIYRDTPAALVYKATWDDEKKFVGTISTLADIAKKNNITKTAIVLVGDAIAHNDYEKSRLYAADFETEFRKRI